MQKSHKRNKMWIIEEIILNVQYKCEQIPWSLVIKKLYMSTLLKYDFIIIKLKYPDLVRNCYFSIEKVC